MLVVTPGPEPGGRWFDSNSRSLRTEVIRLDEEPVLQTGNDGSIPSRTTLIWTTPRYANW